MVPPTRFHPTLPPPSYYLCSAPFCVILFLFAGSNFCSALVSRRVVQDWFKYGICCRDLSIIRSTCGVYIYIYIYIYIYTVLSNPTSAGGFLCPIPCPYLCPDWLPFEHAQFWRNLLASGVFAVLHLYQQSGVLALFQVFAYSR